MLAEGGRSPSEEGGRARGREGSREGGLEGGRARGREGSREGGLAGWRARGREGTRASLGPLPPSLPPTLLPSPSPYIPNSETTFLFTGRYCIYSELNYNLSAHSPMRHSSIRNYTARGYRAGSCVRIEC